MLFVRLYRNIVWLGLSTSNKQKVQSTQISLHIGPSKEQALGSGQGYFAEIANQRRDLWCYFWTIFRKCKARKYIFVVALYKNNEDQD